MFYNTSNVIDCNGRKQTLAFSCPFCKEKDNNFSFCELSSELGCNGPTSSTAKLSSGLPVASICTTINAQIFHNDLSSTRKEAIIGYVHTLTLSLQTWTFVSTITYVKTSVSMYIRITNVPNVAQAEIYRLRRHTTSNTSYSCIFKRLTFMREFIILTGWKSVNCQASFSQSNS